MQLQLYYQLRLLDEDGRVLRTFRRRRSRSFTQEYLRRLRGIWNGETESGAIDITNTSRTHGNTDDFLGPVMNLVAAAGSTNSIRVGTGTTAVTMTDYALATAIAHGTGSGQLSHSAGTIGAFTQSGNDASIQLTRTFTNSSGAAISVTETGLYFSAEDSGGDGRSFMMVRDILPAAVSVPNGQSLAVDYTIKISI